MNKIRLDGRDYVSVKDMRRAIRDCARIVKETYRNFDSEKQAMVYLAYGDIKKKLYEDELKNARTLDEIRAILEMPGDYVVVNDKEKKVFCGYHNGIPEIKELKSKNKNTMVFDFKSKAEADEIVEITEALIEKHRADALDLQPTCNQLATDCISRQAAIDAIDVLKRNYPSSCFEDLCKAVDIAIKALSAQPEIIRCKDCRYSEYDQIFHNRYCHNKGKADLVGDDFFCAAGRYMTNGSD